MSAVLKTPLPVAQTDTPRYNIYVVVHKGLRAQMFDTLLRIGKVDPTDDAETAALIANVEALLVKCEHHLHVENEIMHPAIERARTGSSGTTAHDHVHHEAAIAKLRDETLQFATATPGQRVALVHRLYLSMSAFVAENLTHMITEEVENHAVLIAHYTEEEVLELERRIVATLRPDESIAGLRWMLPNSNAAQRAFLLRGMQHNAPPPAFQAVLGMLKGELSGADYAKLERDLSV